MQRFALVTTADAKLSRWQIHAADCAEVVSKATQGLFIEFIVSLSLNALVQDELAVRPSDDCTEEDFQIMPCCRSAADQRP